MDEFMTLIGLDETTIKILKPCPFCGSEAKLIKTGKSNYNARCTNYAEKCPASFIMVGQKSKKLTMQRWNSRADDYKKKWPRKKQLYKKVHE